ncbi:Hypothetical protein CINCED_3A008427 [Cinara cedri]|uniref:Uncharacterized protein n=1 Tax=Cinara cedri TaxID=506608 RepID=A0A5E4MVA1_9HEMI|nr:Hypothetical protein CINCED_3A008427 [Cinara cedri]
MARLEEKTSYIIHYINLKQVMVNGLVVKKVHRVMQFNQLLWLKDYIDLNTEMRKSNNNVCIHMFTRFAVLDISKTKMYDYDYNVMRKHFKDTINLMYTDTDPLVYHIATRDFYADLLTRSGLL